MCWHTSLDVAAYEMNAGADVLMVQGKRIVNNHPTQAVVEMCRVDKDEAKRMVRRALKFGLLRSYKGQS